MPGSCSKVGGFMILYWGNDTGDDAPIGGTVCVLIETAGDFTGNPLDIGDSVITTYPDGTTTTIEPGTWGMPVRINPLR